MNEKSNNKITFRIVYKHLFRGIFRTYIKQDEGGNEIRKKSEPDNKMEFTHLKANIMVYSMLDIVRVYIYTSIIYASYFCYSK